MPKKSIYKESVIYEKVAEGKNKMSEWVERASFEKVFKRRDDPDEEAEEGCNAKETKK